MLKNVDVAMSHDALLVKDCPDVRRHMSQDRSHWGCEKLTKCIRSLKEFHCSDQLHESKWIVCLSWQRKANGGDEGQHTSIDTLQDSNVEVEGWKHLTGLKSLLLNAASHGSSRGCMVDCQGTCELQQARCMMFKHR